MQRNDCPSRATLKDIAHATEETIARLHNAIARAHAAVEQSRQQLDECRETMHRMELLTARLKESK